VEETNACRQSERCTNKISPLAEYFGPPTEVTTRWDHVSDVCVDTPYRYRYNT
jgi:hypothetical protein